MSKPNPGKGWRRLKVNEWTQGGDEWRPWEKAPWGPCLRRHRITSKSQPHRRRIATKNDPRVTKRVLDMGMAALGRRRK